MTTALLPPGLHDKSLAQVYDLCVAPFPASSTRGVLMQGLSEFRQYLEQFGLPFEIWVDGSFLTTKVNPNDVDVVVMSEAHFNLLPLMQRILLTAVFRERDKTRTKWRVDAFIFFHEDKQMAAYWTDWYGRSREGHSKGIIRVEWKP